MYSYIFFLKLQVRKFTWSIFSPIFFFSFYNFTFTISLVFTLLLLLLLLYCWCWCYFTVIIPFPFIFLFLFTLTFESRASVNPSQPTITCHISAALFFFGITYFYIFFCILIFSINPSKPGIACHISAALTWHSSHYIAAIGREALKSNAKKFNVMI